MELTKEYFDEQLRNLASKNDLSGIKDEVTGVNQRVTAIDQRVENLNERVDNLRRFIQESLVTKDELESFRSELPTKADFARLQTSVDGIAKTFRDEKDERAANYDRLSRIEDWVKKAASQIGIDFKP